MIVERSSETEPSGSQNVSKTKEMMLNNDRFRLLDMSNDSISSIHEEDIGIPHSEL